MLFILDSAQEACLFLLNKDDVQVSCRASVCGIWTRPRARLTKKSVIYPPWNAKPTNRDVTTCVIYFFFFFKDPKLWSSPPPQLFGHITLSGRKKIKFRIKIIPILYSCTAFSSSLFYTFRNKIFVWNSQPDLYLRRYHIGKQISVKWVKRKIQRYNGICELVDRLLMKVESNLLNSINI